MKTTAQEYSVDRARVTLARWTTLCALLFIVGVFAQSANAQATPTGTVTSAATGRTLEGVSVAIKGTDRETVTDRGGSYRFDNVSPGNVILTVSYTGLTTAE